MHHHYEDIRDRISDPPVWYDENAVPRYCNFAPSEVADIYAAEVALVEIACQNCEKPFLVAFSRSISWRIMIISGIRGMTVRDIADLIRDKSLHYGDPPNFGCCAAGPAMNCNDIRVVEYWRRKHMDWERDHLLEIPLADGEPK
jgi:hypothetical protein